MGGMVDVTMNSTLTTGFTMIVVRPVREKAGTQCPGFRGLPPPGSPLLMINGNITGIADAAVVVIGDTPVNRRNEQ
jgi:hypothetical protein